jgi:hypothetical protein
MQVVSQLKDHPSRAVRFTWPDGGGNVDFSQIVGTVVYSEMQQGDLVAYVVYPRPMLMNGLIRVHGAWWIWGFLRPATDADRA